MGSEARETARLYTLLTDKLGSDTTEAMFKYIDNKTVQSVEATIKTLATKQDLLVMRNDIQIMREDIHKEFVDVKKELNHEITSVRKEIGNSVKWMFIFWIGQVGAMLGILLLFFKR
ncbi:MAG: hypothetical protein JST19_22825 [Bacteroidetes bacterium]|nr:hypothetical protein [Bacteroidota bacterium]